MSGWIKLHRQLQDNKLWLKEPFTRGQAWVDLLILANHKPNYIRVRGVRVEVKRGQVGWSEVALAKRWQWSRGKVRRWLKELQEIDRQIVQQKNNVSSLIKITNYDMYQQDGTANSTANGQQTVHEQECKECKEEKPSSGNGKLFSKFWEIYPKKIGRKKCHEKWKLRKLDSMADTIIEDISNRIRYDRKWKDGYIPNPETYINGDRWEDELQIPQQRGEFD